MKKVALITGSAKRVGKEIAHHLASDGWSLALHYNRSDDEAKILQDDLQESYPGHDFFLFQADLNNSIAVESLLPEINRIMGQIDLLVNNASVFEPSAISGTHIDLLERQMMVNFKAPFLLMRDFARLTDEGLIVNLVDTRISTNKSDYAAYSLSKKTLWELTKMAALEFAPRIRVNAIAPGVTLPPEDKGEDYILELAKKIPMKVPGGVEPILKSLDYIIENEYLTGQLLFCDGGENLGVKI